MGEGKRTKVIPEATIIQGLMAITPDGYTIHVPTGRNINPPTSGVPALNDRKFIGHMLDRDPDGWEKTRALKFSDRLPAELYPRLFATVESYPGD